MNHIGPIRVVAIIGSTLLAACAPAASDPIVSSAASPVASADAAPSPAASTPVSPSLSPDPTAAPAAATPEPVGLAPDTIGRVLVTELVVRSAPGVGADSTILEGQLTLDDPVYVIDGPVTADGYQWLLVSRAIAQQGSGPVAGWVATGSREGEPWVEPTEPPCPASADVVTLAGISGEQALYCFGGEELTLDGVMLGCWHRDPVVQDPAWLANSGCDFEAPDRPRVSSWPAISVHLDPADQTSAPSGPARITGRYDHPAAATCRYIEGAVGAPSSELDARLLAFSCRMAFVVEEAEVLEP